MEILGPQSTRPMSLDADSDLVERMLESTDSGNVHELGRRTGTLELVVCASGLAEHVVVADTQDPGARVATLVSIFVEEECDASLGTVVLPLPRRDGHAERRRQEVSCVVGGVCVGGDTQKGRTSQLLHGSLVPLRYDALDSAGLEEREKIGRNVVRGLSGGGTRMRRNPKYDGARLPLPFAQGVLKRAILIAE